MDLAAYGPKEIEDIQFKFASTLYGTSEKPPRYFIILYSHEYRFTKGDVIFEQF
jgi:hypothetical protein